MKAYIIQSGHFSQSGNFMGFSAKGEKIHIYKKDIIRLFPQVGIVYRCLGRYEKELVKLPFYCLAKEKEFDYMDHDGQKTGHKFTRLTAFVISDKEYEIKTAAVQDWADSKIKDLLDDIHNLKIDNDTSYNKMAEKCNNLREENKDLTSTIEVKDRDLLHYRTELETVRRKYDALDEAFDKLAEENDVLIDESKTLKWDLEYSQSERERLRLLCDELWQYRKVFDALKSLTSYQLDQLINNV
jgi:hypothetical protein